MPLVTVTLRATLVLSDIRYRALQMGGEAGASELRMMNEDLQSRLQATAIVIDDVCNEIPYVLRVERT